LLLVYAVVLLHAVLLSALARRKVLSTAVLFLVAGFVLGDDVTGVVDLGPSDPIVSTLAELALFAILFTDPALLAHFVAGLDWPDALLAPSTTSASSWPSCSSWRHCWSSEP
jgi:hypothetical protein